MYFVDADSSCELESHGVPVDAVTVKRARDSKYYLFLPSSADAQRLRVILIGKQQVVIDGVKYRSGDIVTGLKPGSKVKVSGGFNYTMQVMQSANIPAMFISTESGNINAIKDDKSVKEPGLLFMQDADRNVEYSGELDYIRTRGQATFFFSKKPFQIKLASSAPLCGMSKDKQWILLAHYVDKSLIRTSMCLDMARRTNAFAFVPEYQAVDLYLNNGYFGSYLLTEKREIDNGRLDITSLEEATEALNEQPLETMPTFGERLYSRNGSKGAILPNEPEDITGGYLILGNSRVYYAGEVGGFVSSQGQAFTFDSPKYVSEKQVAYMQNLMQRIEDALWSSDGKDPATGQHYTELLDFDTFVYRYVQAEVTAEHDGQRVYFYKDSDLVDGKVYVGPVWDVDNTFGAFAAQRSAKRFYIRNDDSLSYLWFPRAMKHPEFEEAAIRVYNEAYAPMLRILLGEETDETGTLRSIDEYAQEVAASAAMDNVVWPMAQLMQDNFNMNTGSTPAAQIAYLKKYVSSRLEFLNSKWGEN